MKKIKLISVKGKTILVVLILLSSVSLLYATYFDSLEVGTYVDSNRITVKSSDIGLYVHINNPQYPPEIAQSLLSILTKPGYSLNTGDRNQIRLGFMANDDGTPGDKRFFSSIEAVVENPTHSYKRSGLRFLTHGVYGEKEQMRITGTGNVGIGTTLPTAKLHVAGSVRVDNNIIIDTNGELTIYDSAGNRVTYVNQWEVGAYNIYQNSDKRLKKNIKPLNNSLNKILNLQGVKYILKNNPKNNRSIGLIAQDVEKVIPEVVHTNGKGYKSISYGNITAVMVEAIKELKVKTDYKISVLEKENKELRKNIALLESMNKRIIALEKLQKSNFYSKK